MNTPRVTGLLLALLALLLVSGCRMEVAAEAQLDADGTGRAVVQLTADAALVALLDDAGVDPTAEVMAAASTAGDWQVEREVDAAGSIRVMLARPTTDPDDLARAFTELAAGLDDADPALLVDLDISADDRGFSVTGEAAVRPPGAVLAELDDEPIGPHVDELHALFSEHMDARLRLQLPGRVIEHDGDTADARAATWQLPVGESRTISMRAESSGPLGAAGTRVLWASAAVIVLGGLLVTIGAWLRLAPARPGSRATSHDTAGLTPPGE